MAEVSDPLYRVCGRALLRLRQGAQQPGRLRGKDSLLEFLFKGRRATDIPPAELGAVCLAVPLRAHTIRDECGTLRSTPSREAALGMQSSPFICFANNAPAVYIIGVRGLMHFLTGVRGIS